MSSDDNAKLGTFSTPSIGIGGMVGGCIFAVTGLTVEVTKGAAPIAFLIAGLMALLTSYSYLKRTLRFPGEGGTVAFLNQVTRHHLWILAGMILASLVIEAVYRGATGRRVRLVKKAPAGGAQRGTSS